MRIEKPRRSEADQEGSRAQPIQPEPNFHAQFLATAHTQDRIQECLAILNAITYGELLVATPTDPAAYDKHTTAVSMISAVQVLLKDALRELSD